MTTEQAACCLPAGRPVEAILLDAGGVILHPDLDWIGAQVAARGHRRPAPEELLAAYYRTMLEVDLGQSPGTAQGVALDSLLMRRWFFGRLLAHAGLAPERLADLAEALAAAAQASFPRESDIYHWATPGTRERLLALRKAGFRLGVASNNDGALEAQLRSVGVRDLFDACLDSALEGVSKPDPELVLRAARAVGVEPARCVFVGDLDRVDGAAARAAGMPFALLDPLLQPRPGRPLLIAGLGALLDHLPPRCQGS